VDVSPQVRNEVIDCGESNSRIPKYAAFVSIV